MPGRLCVFGNQLCTCPDGDTISSACGRTARLRSRVMIARSRTAIHGTKSWNLQSIYEITTATYPHSGKRSISTKDTGSGQQPDKLQAFDLGKSQYVKVDSFLYFLGTFGGCFGADLCLRSMRATARAGYREVSCRHHLRFRCNLNHIRTRNRED